MRTDSKDVFAAWMHLEMLNDALRPVVSQYLLLYLVVCLQVHLDLINLVFVCKQEVITFVNYALLVVKLNLFLFPII